MNNNFYILNTMIDTSLSFELRAKEEKVKMFFSIFAFFITVIFMISVFFIFNLNNFYNIAIISFAEIVGLIFCFIFNKYRQDCKGYLFMYRKALHDLFASIFEYEAFIKWDNAFEKNLIKQRLLLVNPNV